MFKKLFSKFQFEKINSIILCMLYFILMKTKKKKELPVTVYIQLQKRLTWLEQLTALFLFQLHYNRFMRKKKNVSHLWSDPRKDQLALFEFYAFFHKTSNLFVWLIAATLLFSHNACITFCEEFNKLTIYLATTQRKNSSVL